MAGTGSVAAAPTDYPVRFLGTGSEYFRIWIVNLLLTIVTLGIYSAWAKVRRLKYMYRNTQIADSSFDYHGSPIAILKGRLMALVLLIAYNFSFQLSLIAGVVTLAFLAAIFPVADPPVAAIPSTLFELSRHPLSVCRRAWLKSI